MGDSISLNNYIEQLQAIQNSNTYEATAYTLPRNTDAVEIEVDSNNRTINIPKNFSNAIVYNDHNSLSLVFKIPRYFDDVDFSEKTCVIPYINPNGKQNIGVGVPISVTSDYITIEWNITNDCTCGVGVLTFAISFYSINDDGYIDYQWSTIPTALSVLRGLELIDGVFDVISSTMYEEILSRITAHENSHPIAHADGSITFEKLDITLQELINSCINGGGGGDADLSNYYTKLEMDSKLASDEVIEIGFEQIVPTNTVPGICDFQLHPITKIGAINVLGDSRGFFDPSKNIFYGKEVPLLTTRGKIVVYDTIKSENIYEKEIPELINYNGISDIMLNDRIEKRWSEKFYINKEPVNVSTVETFDWSGASVPNIVLTWEFSEDDFKNVGIPIKADSIDFVSSIFLNVSKSEFESASLNYAHAAIATFSYNDDTQTYEFKCKMRQYDASKKIFTDWTKAYICYSLGNEKYITDDLLSLYLKDGYKVYFEQDDKFDIYGNYAKSLVNAWCPFYSALDKPWWSASDWNTKNIDELYIDFTDTKPNILILLPCSVFKSLEGMERVALELNKKQSEIKDDIEINNYRWIGDGDDSTDYTDIIQNRINDVYYQGGGIIYLGSGTYPISKSLTLYDNVSLIGNNFTILEQKADNIHALVLSGSNIQIKDLTIKLSGVCNVITACIYVNSDNVGNNYDGVYPENKYVRYCTIDNVKMQGTYAFKWTGDYVYKPEGIENYRGVGLYSIRLYFNWCNLKDTVCTNVYAGVHGGGGNNTFEVSVIDSRIAVYENGGYNFWNISGHTYYGKNAEGNNITLTDYILYADASEYNMFNIRFYDSQYTKHCLYFSSMSMGNTYSIHEGCIATPSNASHVSEQFTSDFDSRSAVYDLGRGNRNISLQEENNYAVGGKYLDITGQQLNKTAHGDIDNSLSGAGIWGNISSNNEWTNNNLSLAEICRYPHQIEQINTQFASVISNTSPTEDSPIELIIDISSRPIYSFPNIWIQFDNRYVGEEVKVEWYSDDNMIRRDTVKNNVEPVLNITLSQLGTYKITKIKISFLKALKINSLKYRSSNYTEYNTNYNPNNLIGIVNIGMAANEPFGRAFLGECGGSLYGDINMNGHKFKNIGEPIEADEVVNKAYADTALESSLEWKQIGETVQITQEDIDAAGEDGITALTLDLGAPVTEWYGETMIDIDIPKSDDLNVFTNGRLRVYFGNTLEQSLGGTARFCGVVNSTSNNELLTPAWQQRLVITSNWINKTHLTHSNIVYQHASTTFGYTVRPYATECLGVNDVNRTIIGRQFLSVYGLGKPSGSETDINFKFPVGSKLTLYGRF